MKFKTFNPVREHVKIIVMFDFLSLLFLSYFIENIFNGKSVILNNILLLWRSGNIFCKYYFLNKKSKNINLFLLSIISDALYTVTRVLTYNDSASATAAIVTHGSTTR